jgi:hypothetical protein
MAQCASLNASDGPAKIVAGLAMARDARGKLFPALFYDFYERSLSALSAPLAAKGAAV